MEEIAKIFATAIGIILTIYIAYVLITSLVTITPGFAIIGWAVFIIILIVAILGLIAFFRNIL
jgi:hypothetical protein